MDGKELVLKIQLVEFKLLCGDRLLVSSDGLHAIIGDQVIEQILASEEDTEAAVRELIAKARERGGPDNISGVVIDYR